MAKKSYIKNGKPVLDPNSKYEQGFYKPINPQKYKGDVNNIIFRSGLELRWFRYFDLHKSFTEWNCEEFIIPYMSPIDHKIHRYYMDVWVKFINKKGEEKQILIEIKPLEHTRPPKLPKIKTKYYYKSVNTYLINEAKWNASVDVAKKKNMSFMLLTEKGMKQWMQTQ